MNSLKLTLLLISTMCFSQNRSTTTLRPHTYKSSCQAIIESDPPTQIANLYARWDSSSATSVFDQNNVDATQPAFTGKVRYWRDISGNNNNLECFRVDGSYNASDLADYIPSNVNSPIYLKDSEVISNSETTPKELRSNSGFLLNSDFTFVFVMKANNVVINDWNCFISSDNNAEDNESWQFGWPVAIETDFETGIPVGNSPKTFCILGKSNNSRFSLNTGIPYDNQIHVWVIKVKYGTTAANSNITISVDGNEIRNVNGLKVRMNLVKLFRNRNNSSAFNASFYEFFTYDSLISDEEVQSLSYWLGCKWGVQI